jgi:type II secretory ATPase GspE/PulE/Tfp pilus assembly ATPase PilB-like protein
VHRYANFANLQNGKSLIDWLKEKGAVDEAGVARALAESSRLPFVDLATIALDPAVTALVREEQAVQHQIVPLRVSEQTLSVAMVNPLDRAALRAIEFATGKRVDAEVATQTAIRDALEHLYHLDEALDAYLKNVPEEGELPIAETVDQAATDIRGLRPPPSAAGSTRRAIDVIRKSHGDDGRVELNADRSEDAPGLAAMPVSCLECLESQH